MPVSVGIRLGRATARARMKRLPPALRAAQSQAMTRAVVMVEADLRANSFTGKKGSDAFWGVTGASGDALGARSGHTRRSIVSRTFVGAGGTAVTGTVGSPLPQMKVHEHGGVVRGKPWLRIPTKVMQTPAGVDALAGRSARTLPNTRVITSKRGNPWIVEVGTPRSRRASEIQGFPLMLYMLVRQVTLRPRRMFAASLKRMRPKVAALFSGRFSAVVRGN
jgi:hypothetical protein